MDNKVCTFNPPATPVFDALYELVGKNDVLKEAMRLNVKEGEGFNKKFIEYYKEKFNAEPAYAPETKQAAQRIANAIFDYYYKIYPDINASVNENIIDNSDAFGYPNVTERENGKHHVGTMILDIFNEISNNGLVLPDKKTQWYLNKVTNKWVDVILREASVIQNVPFDTLKQQYDIIENKDKSKFISEILGNENKSITGQCLYSVYRELTENGVNYISEIFSDNRLQYVFQDIKGDLENENIRLKLQQTEENKEETDIIITEAVDDVDDFITKANNHIGQYTSFMTHVGPRIKNYFNTLRKRTSPNSEDFDTNNNFGIAETMDANACCTIIYNQADKTSLPKFIKSIERIAQTIAGFEAFTEFAAYLRNNLDFATEIMTTFSKLAITRYEVVLNNDNPVVRISNKEANPRNVFVFDLRNNISSIIEDINISTLEHQVSELKKEITFLDRNKNTTVIDVNAKLNTAINSLSKLIRVVFSSIDEKAIKTYITLNDNAINDTRKQIQNINSLLWIMERVVGNKQKNKIAKLTLAKEQYNDIKSEASEIMEKNKSLTNGNNGWYNISELQTITGRDFVNPLDKEIQELANCLVPYSNINTSLNSRNIYGNNTSDIINMSWIGRIADMLNSNVIEEEIDAKGNIKRTIRNPKLEKWGLEMLKSPQYKYSSILLEHKEGRNILNYGLFRYEGENLCVTEYATDMIKVMLFNGSSDMDTESNISYADMTSGDYLPSAYMSFFKTDKIDSVGRFDGILATYFLRTPSDAPKTFGISAPKYSIDGLFKYSQQELERRNRDVDELINNTVETISLEKWRQIYGSEKLIEFYVNAISNPTDYKNKYFLNKRVSSDNIKEYLEPNHNILIPDNLSIRPIENSDESYVTFITKGGVALVLQGKVIEVGKGGKALSDAKFIGALTVNLVPREQKENSQAPMFTHFKDANGNKILPPIVYEHFKDKYIKALERGDVNFNGKIYKQLEATIDENHRLFKILFGHFKQEMIDAAVALNHYFVLKEVEGGYIVETEKDGIKPKFKNGVSNTDGCKFYHLGDDGEVLTEIKDENGKITGYKLGGKVFGSNKFTLVVDDIEEQVDDEGNVKKVSVTKGKNYFDAVFDNTTAIKHDGTINFLYGTDMKIQIKDDKVTDVTFSKEQEALITERIKEFLLEYRTQAAANIAKKENVITGVDTSMKSISEFAINYLIMCYNYDDMLEGDSKFYKDSQTILKRAKEVQGSGVPYGIVNTENASEYNVNDVDYLSSWLNSGTTTRNVYETYQDKKGVNRVRIKQNEKGENVTETISIQELFKGTMFEGTTQRNGFYGVTIKNTKRTNTKILNELSEVLKSQGLEEKQIKEILYGKIVLDKNGEPEWDKDTNDYKRSGGFTDTKVNDAQSYITVQEWYRRICARGQGQRYLPLVKKLIDPYYTLTKQDIKEFIQVQKNFYYDLYYDEKYGIKRPRQIKNAEFVLVPQLIKGTQLEQVYELMRECNIDQLNTVETSKASNDEILTLWDNDANITTERLENFKQEAEAAKEIYSYAYLYTQQETPQHMNAENKAGIQLVKKIVDNLPSDDPLKIAFYSLMSANIEESFIKVLDNLEIPRNNDGTIKLDENGNILGINNKVLYNRLKEELLRTGLDANGSDYVTIPDDSDNPLMPAYMNNYIVKFESVLQSMFNNAITRQKLPGFHAPQITNIGWKSMADDLVGLSEEKLKKKDIYKRYEKYVKKNNGDAIAFVDGKLSENDITRFKEFVESEFPLQSYAKELQYHPIQYKQKEADKIITEREYNKLSDEEKKQYEKTTPATYIEIVVPYSYLKIDKKSQHYKNMTDEQILAELSNNGKDNLDTVIGYRIPTEGKQSICNMKIVGFIDDSYGSTIIVPDDWVSQTGSDFDVDSVYGIQYETYQSPNGKINKIKYQESPNIYNYFNYLRRFSDDSEDLDLNTSETVKNAAIAIKKELNKVYIEWTNKKSELFDKLPENIQNAFKEKDKEINKYIEDNGLSKKDGLIYRYNKHLTILNKLVKLTTDQTVKEYRDFTNNLLSYLVDYEEYFKSNLTEAKGIITENKIKELSAIAKENGLLSYEEWSKQSVEKRNTRKARNSKILEIMQKILADPKNLEETLYRSQFEDFIEARTQVMSKNVTNARKNRSPYNIFDQIAYQEEAMSGANLKAMSVSLDTFCSVCNTVCPTLDAPITVVYDKERINVDNVKKSFDGIAVRNNNVIVRHTRYGWSNDNRSIGGKLITAYSSQTTALVLDAIKEGSVPNLNEYSFAIFKTLLNVGCDFRAAVAFIMSDGVTSIIEHNNAKNSVFSSDKSNPIHNAIFDIARQLGISVSKNEPVSTILNIIDTKYGHQFNKIFKIGSKDITISINPTDAEDIPILVEKLVDRIKRRGEFSENSPVEKKLLFDLGTILIFNRLNHTAGKIGDIARCCNPDKFGAKQTVFATREVFQKIDDIIWNRDNKTKELKTPVLSVNGFNMLESIYPGVIQAEGTVEDMIRNLLTSNNSKKSSYPTLYCFLKYASAFSTVVAQQVLETESPIFVKALRGITSVFSGYNPVISEETYADLKKYTLATLYKKVPAIKYGVKARFVDGKIELSLNDGIDENGNQTIEEDALVRVETSRIYGYERPASISRTVIREKVVDGKTKIIRTYVPFEIEDINNPTPQEMEIFEEYSPAQKVKFIQTHFSNAGIFSKIMVNLKNNAKRGVLKGMQTLEFKEQIENSNVIYKEFKNAFYNKNPLIVSAAIDIVKYAMQVEGMNMSAKAVNKIISNDVLINDFGEMGLGFVSSLREQMSAIGSGENTIDADELYENYLRSHPKCKGIRTIYLTSTKNKNKYGYPASEHGAYVFYKPNTGKNAAENEKIFNKKLITAGIKYELPITEDYEFNSYIRIYTKEHGSVLYKINNYGNYVVLYPLPNLQPNEYSVWSANEENNGRMLNKASWEAILAAKAVENTNAKLDYAFITKEAKKLIEEGKETYYKNRKSSNEDKYAKDFNIYEEAEKSQGMSLALNEMETFFTGRYDGKLYLRNRALSEFIQHRGLEYGSTQVIKLKNGEKLKVRIIKDKSNGIVINDKNKPVTEETLNQIKDPQKRALIKDMLDEKSKYVNDLYQVIIVNDEEEANASPLEEVNDEVLTDNSFLDMLAKANSRVASFMISQSNTLGDEASKVALNRIYSAGLDARTNTMRKNSEFSTRVIANYCHTFAKAIDTLFHDFCPDPDKPNAYLPINNPNVLEYIKKDRNLYNKYVLALNLAASFKEIFASYNELLYNSTDDEIKVLLQSIQDDVKLVTALPITDLSHKLNKTIGEHLTTNPIIRDGVVDVLDGFYRTYGSVWKFNDIMENGTPLVQIILKDVMGNIEAQRMASHEAKLKFYKDVEAVFEEAKRLGHTIDMDKIVDKNGDFTALWSKQFQEQFKTLLKAKSDARKKCNFGNINEVNLDAVVEYLKADLEVEKFLTKHVNREAKNEYYEKRCKYISVVLEHAPKAYAKYKALQYRKREIYADKDVTGFTDAQNRELADIRKEEFNLTNNFVYFIDNDGTRRKRPNAAAWTEQERQLYREDDIVDDENYTDEQIALYSENSSKILNEFNTRLDLLDNEYFELGAVFGFEEKLKHFNNIIITREAQNFPASVLENDKEYQEALAWRRENAYFEEHIEDGKSGPMNIMGRLAEARKRLDLGKDRKQNLVYGIFKRHDDFKGIKDEKGILNGSLLAEDEREKVKKLDEAQLTLQYASAYGDANLLANKKHEVEQKLYKPGFYRGMKTDANPKANIEYQATVRSINAILKKYYVLTSEGDSIINIDAIPDDDTGYKDLERLAELYAKLRSIRAASKAHASQESKTNAAKFIEKNVLFKINEDVFKQHKKIVRNKSQKFQQLAVAVMFNVNADGNPYFDEHNKPQANTFLYGYAVPKNEQEWLDTERMEDIALLKKYYRRVTTKYYDKALVEAQAKGDAYYDAWYEANHVYNPETKQYQPISCWYTYELNTDLLENQTIEGRWMPKGKSKIKNVRTGESTFKIDENQTVELYDVKKDKRNPAYKQNQSVFDNYRYENGKSEYDNPVTLNESEQKLSKLYRDTLQNLAKTDKARRYFAKHLPKSPKGNDENVLKTTGKELLKTFGIAVDNNKQKQAWNREIGFEHDFVPDMPLTSLLRNKHSIDYEKKLQQLQKDLQDAQQVTYQTEAEKAIVIQNIEKEIEETKQKIQDISNSLLNRDYTKVIGEYIEQVSRYNAIIENKQILYHLLNTLRQMKMFSTKGKSTGRLLESQESTKEVPVFDESLDDNLIKQYENFLRRLMFDQWKEPDNKVRIMNALQGFTSANYMMLNIRGGVANVTLGETGILAEAAAGEFLGKKDWGFGTAEWQKGIIGFARRGFMLDQGEDKCFNLQDAVVQYFNVFDYDEKAGVVRELTLEDRWKKLRDSMFLPQNIGEHFMQNSVLFAMLHCHKVIIMNDGKATYMNKQDYIRYRESEILDSVLTDEQKVKFAEFKKNIKSDKNIQKDYAWFRKDVISRFLITCSKEEREAYGKKRKEKIKEILKQFEELPNMYDQMEFKDGKLAFKEESALYRLNQELAYNDSTVTKAQELLGLFTEKVRKVNNKIHGVYNKDGRAYIESKWYGGLVMQYHKHLPIGLLKRYMRRGHWNEFRESVDKGMFTSLIDLHRLNLDAVKQDAGMTDEQLGAFQGFIFMMTHCMDYLAHIKTTLAIAPEYDKANNRRFLGCTVGVVAAMLTVAALWALAGGDDDDEVTDELWWNFMLYEADRLASEAFLYNPYGLFVESKKLMSSPLASKSIIDDGIKSIGLLINYVTDDEYDPYYHSGRFAGQHKLSVYIQRRIPMWSAINSILGLPSSNHYYKLGENPIGLVNVKERVANK